MTSWAGETAPPAGSGSCVACHRTVEGVTYLEHNFADWEKSIHAKAKVVCEACHIGDSSQKEKAKAHVGMLSSTDSRSPVYFTRIPTTCGTCHSAELKAFQRSSHYRELEKSGRGPNCVTCHGSMANHVLAPRELEMTCTLCHRRPTQAYATLMALNNAGLSLKRLEDSLAGARSAKLEVAQQEREHQKAQGLYRKALTDWHTFKMRSVLKAAQEVTRACATAANELQIKGLQQDEPSRP